MPQQVWTSWPGGIGYPTTIPLSGGKAKKTRKASKKSRKTRKMRKGTRRMRGGAEPTFGTRFRNIGTRLKTGVMNTVVNPVKNALRSEPKVREHLQGAVNRYEYSQREIQQKRNEIANAKKTLTNLASSNLGAREGSALEISKRQARNQQLNIQRKKIKNLETTLKQLERNAPRDPYLNFNSRNLFGNYEKSKQKLGVLYGVPT